MTNRARKLAIALHAVLPAAQKLGCSHGIAGWGFCTGAVWVTLVDCGDARAAEVAEWRALCGIPSQAEAPRGGDDMPEPKGRPS